MNITVSGSKHKPPENETVPDRMSELIKWYDENKSKLHPIQLATEFHHRFVYIHPFTDGNGRTARLLMNLILMQNGYPPAIIRIEDRLEYMQALEKASVDDDILDFMGLVARSVENSLDIYMHMLNLNKDRNMEIK